jgi:xanthine/CO dehydrogenase XdhC/CoxF family maturation factor
LDLGAVGPEEIAVSIAAELVAVKRGKAVAQVRPPTLSIVFDRGREGSG